MLNRKKREKVLYNPMRMTEALREVGAQYDRKEALLYYIVILAIALSLGVLMELRIGYIALILLVYGLMVPKLFLNTKKQAFEKQRFNDVNAYMRQMAQSFIKTENVIESLRQTAGSFSSGRMLDTLMNAVTVIDEGSSNILSAKKEAIQIIENAYNCEKLSNLHDFLFIAEQRGGHCSTEFSILEKMRNAWKKAVSDYRYKLLKNKIIGTVTYVLLLVFCVIFLNVMRYYDINIIDSTITQITNTVLIIVFLMFYVKMDDKLNESLLKDSKMMSKETADKYFAYIADFDSKRERKKHLLYSIIAILIAVLIFGMMRNAVGLVLVGVALTIGFNIHNIMLLLIKAELGSEISKAFPKWLFDIILLIQRESIEGAIKLSIDKAPPVMKTELQRISNQLDMTPHDRDAYISFFADFKYLEIEEVMRTLYSLAVGNGYTNEVMSVVIESNIELLNASERNSIEMKSSLSGHALTPILIVSFGVMMYLVVAIIIVVDNVMGYF